MRDKMYYTIVGEDRVRVAPNLLVMSKEDAVKQVLKEKYEGKVDKRYGIVLKITKAKPKGKGIILPGDPYIYQRVEFEALTFLPAVNEVFRGVVRDVLDFGAFVSIGPFEGLLHISQISKERFSYDRKAKALVSQQGKKMIKKGDILWVKVSTISLKPNPQDVKIGLTMRAEGLGKDEWLEEKKKEGEKKKKGGKK